MSDRAPSPSRQLASFRRPDPARAFTLIELLVVTTIILILIAISLPALSTGRKRADATVCSTHMKSIYTASLLYAEDFGAIPGALSYKTKKNVPSGNAWGWYTNEGRPWTRGPGFTVQNMEAGYLPKTKDTAWCPAKSRADHEGQMFWQLDLDDQEWGMLYSPYAGNGQRFSPLVIEQYETGGAISMTTWDRYSKAYFFTETQGGHLIQSALDVDGAPDGAGRHLGNVLVTIADGHIVEMPAADVRTLIMNNDRTFCWGE